MLANRKSILGSHGATNFDKPPSVCNPRPAWRRTSTTGLPASQTTCPDAAVAAYNAAQPGDHQPHCSTPSVLTSTTPTLAGYRVARVIGTVYGSTTGQLPKDGAKAWLKSVCGMGGECRNLTNVLYGARDTATERMVLECVTRGGNAVVGMSFTEGEVMGCLTVSAQGTAVYIESVGVGAAIKAEDPFR